MYPYGNNYVAVYFKLIPLFTLSTDM